VIPLNRPRRRLDALAWLAPLLIAGCASSPVIGSREAASARPMEYSTFRLNAPTVGQTDPELARSLIQGLEAKGYRPVGEDAELVVTYKLLFGSMDESASDGSEAPAIVHDDMFSSSLTTEERESKILIVLIQDARTLDTLWVGWSHAEAREDEVESRARQALTELVTRIPERTGA
jgi:hypothetical protein